MTRRQEKLRCAASLPNTKAMTPTKMTTSGATDKVYKKRARRQDEAYCQFATSERFPVRVQPLPAGGGRKDCAIERIPRDEGAILLQTAACADRRPHFCHLNGANYVYSKRGNGLEIASLVPMRLRTLERGVVQLLVPAALVLGIARAQVEQFEGKPIAEIHFSLANPLTAEDLEKALPLKKGEPLRKQDVAQAIDALFATGAFQDIVVQAEPSGNGVALEFITENTRFLGGVTVEGGVKLPPNRGQIASATQFRLGTPFHEEDVTGALDAIKHLLESNGLYQAQVTPSIERDREGEQVFLTFHVKEGKRAKYEAPVVEGDESLSDSTVARVTGWRIPIIHWWRQVTDSRTRKGVQGVLGQISEAGPPD